MGVLVVAAAAIAISWAIGLSPALPPSSGQEDRDSRQHVGIHRGIFHTETLISFLGQRHAAPLAYARPLLHHSLEHRGTSVHHFRIAAVVAASRRHVMVNTTDTLVSASLRRARCDYICIGDNVMLRRPRCRTICHRQRAIEKKRAVYTAPQETGSVFIARLTMARNGSLLPLAGARPVDR